MMRTVKVMTGEEPKDCMAGVVEMVVGQSQLMQLLLPNQSAECSFFEDDLEVEVVPWPELR